MSFVPITPAGSICAHLESATEDQAWAALLNDAGEDPA